MQNVGDGVLKGITRVIVQTEGDNPKLIATITAEDIDPVEGYVVRLRPNYDEKD